MMHDSVGCYGGGRCLWGVWGRWDALGAWDRKEGRASHVLYMSEGEGGCGVRGERLWRWREVGRQLFTWAMEVGT